MVLALLVSLPSALAEETMTITVLEPGSKPHVQLRYSPRKGNASFEVRATQKLRNWLLTGEGASLIDTTRDWDTRAQLTIQTKDKSTAVHLSDVRFRTSAPAPTEMIEKRMEGRAFPVATATIPTVASSEAGAEMASMLLDGYPPLPGQPVGPGALYLVEERDTYEEITVHHRRLFEVVAIEDGRVTLRLHATPLAFESDMPLPGGTQSEQVFLGGGETGTLTVGLHDLSLEGDTVVTLRSVQALTNPTGGERAVLITDLKMERRYAKGD